MTYYRTHRPLGEGASCGLFLLFEKLSGVRTLTTFYLAKNDHRWVTFISLKTPGGYSRCAAFSTRFRRQRGDRAAEAPDERLQARGGRLRGGERGLRRRMNDELNFPPNFERLVLGCIDADFCK